ncbi:hypothetical protein GCM10010176_026370 [Nonomuraea spiralis]|nr:hypothetical protein GCM10010176_026370 [Nonomuraea spiralis]
MPHERLQCVREFLAHLLAWSDPEIARDLADPFDGSGGQSVDGAE